MRVAVLGLGHMGRAIAGRLLDTGHDVTVWNRTPGREVPFVERGARAAVIAEAVSDVDVIMTMLTADAAVKQVTLGEGGVIANLPAAAVLVDMSTVSPRTSRELGEKTPPGRFVDAPILGGPEVAGKGQARLLLGGDESTVSRLDPLWNDISAGYTYCGPNGTATTMKLLSNLILVGGTILLAEAVATGQANDITDEVLRQVLSSSPAVAPGVRVRLDDLIGGDHRGWWTIKLAEKDIQLALELAQSNGRQLPLGSAAEQALQETDRAGYGDLDLGAVVELVRGKKQ